MDKAITSFPNMKCNLWTWLISQQDQLKLYNFSDCKDDVVQQYEGSDSKSM